ncbi:hypothetical protein BDV97DRAFT_407760 [Delphinella strobiligena]|nr:hypothetical protein BDV97DRAFT_407760 [Delphinella strobiligena]
MSGNCQLHLRQSRAKNAVIPGRRLVLVFKRTNAESARGPCGACSRCALFTFIGIEDFEDANPLLVPLPEAVAPLAQCLDVEERDVEREKIVTATAGEDTKNGTVDGGAGPCRTSPDSVLLSGALTATLVNRANLSIAQSTKNAEGRGVDEHPSPASSVNVEKVSQIDTAAHELGATLTVTPPTHFCRRNVHNESDGSRWLSDIGLIIKDYVIGQPWLPVLPNYIRRLLACRKREGCEAAKVFIEGLINTGDWAEEANSNFVTESDGSVWYGRDVDTILDYLNDDPDTPVLSDDIRRLLSARANEECKVAKFFIEDLIYNNDWDESVVEGGSWTAIRQSWSSAQRRFAS